MSILLKKRTNDGPPIGRALAFAILGLAGLIVATLARARGPAAGAGPSSDDSPSIGNPIRHMLARAQDVPRSDGVAAAVLVDTSGSMRDTVLDADGRPRTKIDVARRRTLDFVRRTERIARERPDRRVVLGVYEFSARPHEPSCRPVLTAGPPDARGAEPAIARLDADGGTPIGDAIIHATRELHRTGLRSLHLLVVTDGANTNGYAPADVARALAELPEGDRPALYFIAFDVSAEVFGPVRDAGALVLAAGDEAELQRTLEYVLTGKILAEAPSK